MEVCVKHKNYVSRHKEVQVYLSEDDYHFFKRVKDAYLEIRRPRWNIFLRPFHIKHVQFSVQNMGSVVGIFHHDGPRIPPEEDVQSGSYHYHPCPWHGEPVPSSIILHELNSKKSQLHTSRTWSTRIPKKCAASIFSVPHPDDAAIGYGIHIIEDCDGVVLIIMLVIGPCVTALVTALWWSKGKPGDIQGATGLESLLLGSFGALALCYQSLPSG
ncbi:hypothetical protein B0O99DRAFT_618507 [Bisporella sp. PMI_857]|nr:hypothetical protein B0O99DRAFT_618507 [Bisporella sp. PMI_857]